MKNIKLLLAAQYLGLVLIAILTVFPAFSQNDPYPAWRTFTDGNQVRKMVEEGDFIWAATEGGLVKLHKKTGKITHYNTGNSQLPDNNLDALAIDKTGTKWIGSSEEYIKSGGLVAFDGRNWTIYNESNSGLPDNDITTIAIDQNGNKWLGTPDSNVVKFTGNQWMTYDIINRLPPNDGMPDIAIDQQNHV